MEVRAPAGGTCRRLLLAALFLALLKMAVDVGLLYRRNMAYSQARKPFRPLLVRFREHNIICI